MNIAIILAGGIGSRVGESIPKQFIEIRNKPILAYTIDKFENHKNIDAIEIVCISEYIDYINKMVSNYNYKKVKWVVEGGNNFQESVMNGVYHLKGIVSDDDIVLTHFGVSPFVEESIITDAINVCKLKGNAISTTPFYLLSTLKDEKDKNMAGKWIDRDSIACMNSPHAFKYNLIYNIYKKAEENNYLNCVEPHTTSLMQYMGVDIYFSKGSQTNIKITTKEDLDLFKGFVLLEEFNRNESNY